MFPYGQAGLTKLMVAFRNFESAPENKYYFLTFQKISVEAVKP